MISSFSRLELNSALEEKIVAKMEFKSYLRNTARKMRKMKGNDSSKRRLIIFLQEYE